MAFSEDTDFTRCTVYLRDQTWSVKEDAVFRGALAKKIIQFIENNPFTGAWTLDYGAQRLEGGVT